MSGYEQTGEPGVDELLFLALGGTGEIGMNLNLYGHAGAWLMVDLGITFGDDTTPGVDVIMPDPAFIEERADSLAGIVLTHAHEDHIGAVPYLWSRLRCPLYATPFTASLLRRKLAEVGLLNEVTLHVVPLSGKFSVGPFEIELITLTHSIPEPNACVIRTPLGTVMHTGDWKLDPGPLVGMATDVDALVRVGEEGVLAMVCDSTNVLVSGHSGSESDVRQRLIELVGGYRNRVVVACFASNIARMETAAEVGRVHDRHVALVGRSLWRYYEAARENGYLKDTARFLTAEEAGFLPRNKVLYICTGSQGEPRAALARIARKDHPDLVLEPHDTVIFSSRKIPGNEKSIGRLQNDLAALGLEVVTTSQESEIHVSGHPAREELVQMYQWIRPRIAVPVHGESRHLHAHAALAEECQVPDVLMAPNGTLARLAPGPVEILDQVYTGRLALDGNRLLQLDGSVIRERKRMQYNGAAVATVVVDGRGRLVGLPQVTIRGVYDADAESDVTEDLVDAIARAVDGVPPRLRGQDAALSDAARGALRGSLRRRFGKRPDTEVHLVRV